MPIHIQRLGVFRCTALLLGVAAALWTGFVQADPPTRVARLGYVSGPVSFSPAGEDDWVQAMLNRPLVTGDRLWVDGGARVELQIGNATIRLGPSTSITLLNLDDLVAQLQLTQGTLSARVRRLEADQVVEIDTPNLAYVVIRPGQFRVSVDPNGEATQVSADSGQAVVYGEGASYAVNAGTSYRFFGTGLRDYENLALSDPDELGRWAQERDRSYDNSNSARYVSRDVIGAQDLDAYGTWRAVPEYGNVWTPTRVSADWAPYRDGHWAWVDPWGWTWVDDAPWGFAVSHYGRWANIGGGWGWIPGPVAARAVYAPALVAFIGGGSFQVGISSARVSAVGWFPLGPRDIYRPAYPVSRNYFNNVNVTNTVINTTNITNVYNNPSVTNVTYVNRQVAGAVVTVPTTAFVQSQPVARAAVRVSHDEVVRAAITPLAAIAPSAISVRGAAAQGARPPQQVLERPVVAKSAPPAASVGFAAREHAMAGNPGKPMDPATLATLRPGAQVIAPKVAIVTPVRTAGPIGAPPPQAQAAARSTDLRPDPTHVTTPPTQPSSTPQPSAPPQARLRGSAPTTFSGAPASAAPTEIAKPLPQRANASPPKLAPQEQRDNARVVPVPPVPVIAPQPVVRPSQAAPPMPAQAPPEPRTKPEARGQPMAPVTGPAAPRPPPELQRALPPPSAAAKSAPSAPAPPAPQPPAAAKPMLPSPPIAQPSEQGHAAGPPPKAEQRGKESRTVADKKGDEPGKGEDEPKRK